MPGDIFMLKRKILSKLVEWKAKNSLIESRTAEVLILEGARQIGKTYIIRAFAKEYYKQLVEINFLTEPEMKEVFAGTLTSEEIFKQISIKKLGVKFIKGETILFLDEIQVCPEARTALKFLASENKVDVIASGSLLGLSYGDSEMEFAATHSVPVGYERKIKMFSLDFEEFLWAKGVWVEIIRTYEDYFQNKQPVPTIINANMFKHLAEYMVVGGMPEVVCEFINEKNFSNVHRVQQKIMDSYLDDITKHALKTERPKIKNAYLSIPRQLAKENKKFMYSVVEKRATARKYTNSLERLRDADLIKYCRNVSTPKFPLVGYEKEEFKIYVADIGLLVFMFGFEMKDAIINNKLAGQVKGGIYENLIADFLCKKELPLYYYKTENNSQEIEFLLNHKTDIIPVEVKASNGPTVSLNEYIKQFNPIFAYKFINGNTGVSGTKITYPMYMAMFL